MIGCGTRWHCQLHEALGPISGDSETHRLQSVTEPRIAAEAVPLRCNRKMHERRVAAVERAIKPAECVVEIARLGMQYRESDIGAAVDVLRLLCGIIERASRHGRVSAARVGRHEVSGGGAYLLDHRRWTSERLGLRDVLLRKRIEVAGHQLRAGQELARKEVPRIDLERLVRPHDCLGVVALVPVGGGVLDAHERRERIALEGLLFQLEALLQVSQRLHQAAVVQPCLGVIRADLEPPPQAALRADPIPFAEEQHGPERDLRVRTGVVHGERAQRGSLRVRVRRDVRRRAERRLRALRQRDAGVRGRIGSVERDRGLKGLDRLRNFEVRRGQQMGSPAPDELDGFERPAGAQATAPSSAGGLATSATNR